MSQPAISKHLKVLERAGLISRGRDAQRRPRRLEAKPLAEATDWLERYREFWEARFQRLDALLDELQARRRNADPRTREESAHDKHREADGRGAQRPGDRHDARLRCAPRAGLRGADQAGAAAALAGRHGGLDDAGVRDRPPRRRRLSLRLAPEASGAEMGMGGVFREIVPPERIVAPRSSTILVPGEAVDTLRLGRERADDAHLTVRYDSQKRATPSSSRRWRTASR